MNEQSSISPDEKSQPEAIHSVPAASPPEEFARSRDSSPTVGPDSGEHVQAHPPESSEGILVISPEPPQEVISPVCQCNDEQLAATWRFSSIFQRSRKRRELEARFGKSPLYFELKANGMLGVYLDRDLARSAGIFPGDRIKFFRETEVPNQFSLAKANEGWRIKSESRHGDLLCMSPKIATPQTRDFHWFVFDAQGSTIPTEVRLTQEEGRLFIDFTLPHIIPPITLQTHPLVLTRAYGETILNLDRSLASGAGMHPGHPLSLGFDPDQYPGELLIFHWSDQVTADGCTLVNDRWYHFRSNIIDNSQIFPGELIHLTPPVRIGDYSLSPRRPRIKVLVITMEPAEGHSWDQCFGRFKRPYYLGSPASEESTTSGLPDDPFSP